MKKFLRGLKKRNMNQVTTWSVGALLFIAGFVTGFLSNKIADKVTAYDPNPLVSVVMATYNRPEGVAIAIESILNQTYKNFEFIIIDDGSSDDTAKIVKKYAKKDKRIVFLKNKENKGLIYSLNRGLDKAKGKYIVRMDDDDASIPERIERQVLAMEMHPEIAIMGTRITSKNAKVTIPTTPPVIDNPKEVEIRTYFSSGLAHPTIIIRRAFLEKNKIRYNPAYLYAEDCGLYKDVLKHKGLISALQEPLLRFGVIERMPKKDGYGATQYASFKKIQKEKLDQFGITGSEKWNTGYSKDRCTMLKKMRDANKTKNILNAKSLNYMIEQECPKIPKDAIMVEHPYWKDYFVMEKNGKRFKRFSNTDTGRIIAETPKTVTVKWDKWDTEVYKKVIGKNKTTKYIYEKDADGKIKVIPQK